MLGDGELLELYRAIESDRVERKEALTHIDRVAQAVCAFANDLPNHNRAGVIFVGQRDDGTCANVRVDDVLLTRLGGLRLEVTPFPTLYVRRVSLDGCEVAVLEVEPSENPPVRLDGRVWIRVGPRRAIATAEEERRLIEKRRWGTLPFDAHPIRGAELSDLDLKRFELEYLPAVTSPEALAENGRSLDQQLRALRLVHADGVPTVTAVLMLGRDPRQWLPGAYVQFLRVNGTELTDDLIDHRVISGTLSDQIRQVEELVRLNIGQPVTVGGPTRLETPDYPEEAIRQLVRNALIHRSYEGTAAPVRITWFVDRIEIQSPGGPYGQVTKAHFGEPGIADYRNPTIAESLKALGFIERFGVGIPIARDRLAKNGNPPLQFRVEDEHILATVRKRP